MPIFFSFTEKVWINDFTGLWSSSPPVYGGLTSEIWPKWWVLKETRKKFHHNFACLNTSRWQKEGLLASFFMLFVVFSNICCRVTVCLVTLYPTKFTWDLGLTGLEGRIEIGFCSCENPHQVQLMCISQMSLKVHWHLLQESNDKLWADTSLVFVAYKCQKWWSGGCLSSVSLF